MEFNELSKKLKKVTDNYIRKAQIEVTNDQGVLKINEEVGEFNKAYLKYIGTGNNKENKSKEELRKDLEEELADAVSMCLVFAEENSIDLKRVIDEKWLKYLPE
ncbi:hypothetical protein GF389_06165 [Candidatus Dojkabacteria bacterium]|nr:hypothetical protein [Candidatus Dojkabacteria bacterium]